MCVITPTMAALAGGGALAAKALAPKAPKAPAAVDPAVERAAAEARATQATNSKLAERNRSRKASSLLALDTASSNVPALGGKTTLGQ
jgi:hypothetical protein